MVYYPRHCDYSNGALTKAGARGLLDRREIRTALGLPPLINNISRRAGDPAGEDFASRRSADPPGHAVSWQEIIRAAQPDFLSMIRAAEDRSPLSCLKTKKTLSRAEIEYTRGLGQNSSLISLLKLARSGSPLFSYVHLIHEFLPSATALQKLTDLEPLTPVEISGLNASLNSLANEMPTVNLYRILRRRLFILFLNEIGFSPTEAITKSVADTAALYISKSSSRLNSFSIIYDLFNQHFGDIRPADPELKKQWLIAAYNVAMKGKHDSLEQTINIFKKSWPDLFTDKRQSTKRLLLIVCYRSALSSLKLLIKFINLIKKWQPELHSADVPDFVARQLFCLLMMLELKETEAALNDFRNRYLSGRGNGAINWLQVQNEYFQQTAKLLIGQKEAWGIVWASRPFFELLFPDEKISQRPAADLALEAIDPESQAILINQLSALEKIRPDLYKQALEFLIGGSNVDEASLAKLISEIETAITAVQGR